MLYEVIYNVTKGKWLGVEQEIGNVGRRNTRKCQIPAGEHRDSKGGKVALMERDECDTGFFRVLAQGTKCVSGGEGGWLQGGKRAPAVACPLGWCPIILGCTSWR